MNKFFRILRGCLVRVAVAVVFTAAWQKVTEGGVPVGNCLVLCGAVNGLLAWFSYLHLDGVKLMGDNTTVRSDGHTARFMAFLTRKENKRADPFAEDNQKWADPFYNKQDPQDDPFRAAGAVNGLISMVLLIGASFFV